MINYYPLPFLVVGLLVLFLRVEDKNAWLLALMFAGFIAAAPVAFLEGVLSPPLRRFMLSYMILLYGMMPAVFYWFFGTFPTSSPIDRKLPWLKWLLLGVARRLLRSSRRDGAGHGQLLRCGCDCFSRLESDRFFAFVGRVSVRRLRTGTGVVDLEQPEGAQRSTTAARHKSWSGGRLPAWVRYCWSPSFALVQHKVYYSYPFWFVVLPIIALGILPVSFAYAVVKYRALEIPVLLKRSARYFLVQRGFLLLILLAGIGATLLLAHALNRYFPERGRSGVPAGAAFGIFLVWGGTQMQSRVTRRLDRAFFRSAYDTRQILIDLAAKTRNASNREQLAELLRHEIDDALHPLTLAIYFRREQWRTS